MKQTLFTLAAALCLAGAVCAEHEPGHKVLVLKNKEGVAILGYDAVAYFTDSKPVKGHPRFESEYDGAKYHFVSAEHKALFDQNPAKYAPAFGGFSGYAASINRVRPVNVNLWSIVDGRLILQSTSLAVRLWNQDVRGNLERADRNWPGLVQRETARKLATSKYPLTWPGFYDYGHGTRTSASKVRGAVTARSVAVDRAPMAGDLTWSGF